MLLTYLDRLHGREGDVGEELGRGRGRQVQGGSVQVGLLLSQHTGVDVLEDFIEAEFPDTLEGIQNQFANI